jgi:hypothetical protein
MSGIPLPSSTITWNSTPLQRVQVNLKKTIKIQGLCNKKCFLGVYVEGNRLGSPKTVKLGYTKCSITEKLCSEASTMRTPLGP